MQTSNKQGLPDDDDDDYLIEERNYIDRLYKMGTSNNRFFFKACSNKNARDRKVMICLLFSLMHLLFLSWIDGLVEAYMQLKSR